LNHTAIAETIRRIAMKFALAATLAAVSIAGSAVCFADTDDSHYKDLYDLKQLHLAFHQALSHAGLDVPTKAQHLEDMLSLWTEHGTLIAGGVTYHEKGTPGAASCDPGALTLCDFFANHAGAFVLGRDWVSLTPIFTESFTALNEGTADIYFQCIYLDVNNSDKVMSNASIGLPGQPGTGRAKKVQGQWLLDYALVGSVPLPTLDVPF
jgi:hypothetical protein